MSYKTMGEMADELNEWLKIQHRHAELTRKLPGAKEAAAQLKCLWDNVFEYPYSYMDVDSVIKKYHARCEELGITSDCGDLWFRTHIDVRNSPDRETPYLYVISVIETKDGQEQFAILAAFHCTYRFVEIDLSDADKDESKNVVWSVEPVEGGLSIQDVIERAIDSQLRSGKSIWERWMGLPYSMRKAHPICPSCGGAAREATSVEGLRYITCDDCDWVSRKTPLFMEDFVDVAFFQKELAYAQKVRQADSNLALSIENAQKSVDELSAAVNAGIKFGVVMGQDVEELQSIQTKVSEMLAMIQSE